MDAYPLDWESLWAFIPIVCASIGICITLDVVAVFIIYNRYVSHVLFFGYEKSSTVPLALVRTIVEARLLPPVNPVCLPLLQDLYHHGVRQGAELRPPLRHSRQLHVHLHHSRRAELPQLHT